MARKPSTASARRAAESAAKALKKGRVKSARNHLRKALGRLPAAAPGAVDRSTGKSLKSKIREGVPLRAVRAPYRAEEAFASHSAVTAGIAASPLSAAQRLGASNLPKDGTYEGDNGRLALALRVDAKGLDIISGDLFRQGLDGVDYLASFRTRPGLAVTEEASSGHLPIVAQDNLGGHCQGRLSLAPGQPQDEGRITVTLFFGQSLNGLSSGSPIVFQASWRRAAQRRLGLEIEVERRVKRLKRVKFGGAKYSIASVFAEAGIEIEKIGKRNRVRPAPPGGWGQAELYALMLDMADSVVDRPSWDFRLLWLSTARRQGLAGVMFDPAGDLPRQGCAVFAGATRQAFPEKSELRLLRTAVHEIGHGLNLAHRFDREVGHANSFSLMNYPWRHTQGAKTYWRHFAFSFDRDELEFLRHGPRHALIPGGAPFQSAHYWRGSDPARTYLPEHPTEALGLELLGPPQGAQFEVGQPVFLSCTLKNQTGRALRLPRFILDPKAGLLEVTVRRVDGAAPQDGGRRFSPVVDRCFDVDEAPMIKIPKGGTYSDNLQLTFGTKGFTFAEPARYLVQALLTLPASGSKDQDGDVVARSLPLTITIRHPASREDELATDVLIRDDVGMWFALGGTYALDRADSDLGDLAQERAERFAADPIATTIFRAQALDACRDYKARPKRRARGADLGKAVACLDRIQSSMDVFDAETAAKTKQFATQCRALLKKA